MIEGFIGRIWKTRGVDNVTLVKKGIYIMRFLTMEKRDHVLANGNPFFGSKPLIMKAWHADMDIEKDNFDVLLSWVELKVDFKY